jgi:hypothetical protein
LPETAPRINELDLSRILEVQTIHAFIRETGDNPDVAMAFKHLASQRLDCSNIIVEAMIQAIKKDNATLFGGYFSILNAVIEIKDARYLLQL